VITKVRFVVRAKTDPQTIHRAIGFLAQLGLAPSRVEAQQVLS
jgi:hypothetical protein